MDENQEYKYERETREEREKRKESARTKISNTWKLIIYMFGGGIGAILLICVKNSGNKSVYFFNAAGCSLLIAGASLCFGGLLGFIFGIPSMTQNSDMRVKYNDNLVQISDWLTKIIVGVGLTQMSKIPYKINLLCIYLSNNIGIGGEYGRNSALAIILYFLILGFISLYFWTRTDYTQIVKDIDDGLQQKVKELREKNELIEKEKTELEHKSEQQERNLIATIQKVEDKLVDDLTEHNVITSVESLLIKNLPPITAFNDPQKRRFGGKSENSLYKISAEVTDSNQPKWPYKITITVEQLNSANLHNVVFMLHNSFNPFIQKISSGEIQEGKAILELISYGSFTIGAIINEGETLLELDLAELPNVTAKFKAS